MVYGIGSHLGPLSLIVRVTAPTIRRGRIVSINALGRMVQTKHLNTRRKFICVHENNHGCVEHDAAANVNAHDPNREKRTTEFRSPSPMISHPALDDV